MIIGFDVDGVLADFYEGYEQAVRYVSGRDLFPARTIGEPPPVWNWPEYYGYTKTEVDRAWEYIKTSPTFWYNLNRLPGSIQALVLQQQFHPRCHDVYYITARPGLSAKDQTERWLKDKLAVQNPTVCLSTLKGAMAFGLDLDVYVDDRLENAIDVVGTSPTTRCYLLDRPYNQGHTPWTETVGVRRVPDLKAVVLAEQEIQHGA